MSENIDIDNTLTSVIEDKKNEIQVLEKQVYTLTDALSLLKKGNIDYSKTPIQEVENVEEENVNAVTVEENVEEGDDNAVVTVKENAVATAEEDQNVNVEDQNVNVVNEEYQNANTEAIVEPEPTKVGGLTRKSVSFFDLFPEKVTRRRRRKARKTKRHRSGKKKRRSTRRR